jgi:hypothetical protein
MATPAQVLANRQNSLHSTGPATETGKAASSRNAVRHGLTSKQIVMPGEDPAEYDALRESLIEQFAPAGEIERTLVEEIAAGSWRLARARRHETAILKKLVGDAKDPDEAFAELFLEKPKEVERLLRYITTIERSYYRALNKLQQMQKTRSKEVEPAIGFVSQNAPMLDFSATSPASPAPLNASAPMLRVSAGGEEVPVPAERVAYRPAGMVL